MGFYDSPKESEKIAESVSSTGGVVFIPALCGFGAPINDPTASAGFLGPVLILPWKSLKCIQNH